MAKTDLRRRPGSASATSPLPDQGTVRLRRSEHLPPRAVQNQVDARATGMTILKWALIFLVISIIAGIFGFTGISAASADIARILFYIFVVIFIVLLILGLTIFRA